MTAPAVLGERATWSLSARPGRVGLAAGVLVVGALPLVVTRSDVPNLLFLVFLYITLSQKDILC